ncbi:MAG: ATP-binding protein [Bacteroidetes bacterium]|nr:ATP-binding protein [Bacteroidota bacterium]
MKKQDGSFELRIPSSRSSIHRVEEFFRSVNESIGMPDERLHTLLVSVTEAVNNGIIHGNKNNESKFVTVNVRLEERTLSVTVADEGEGFVPSSVANPLQEENLLNTGGRGVFLMKAFMQSVTYNAKGNEVTMVMTI